MVEANEDAPRAVPEARYILGSQELNELSRSGLFIDPNDEQGVVFKDEVR